MDIPPSVLEAVANFVMSTNCAQNYIVYTLFYHLAPTSHRYCPFYCLASPLLLSSQVKTNSKIENLNSHSLIVEVLPLPWNWIARELLCFLCALQEKEYFSLRLSVFP